MDGRLPMHILGVEDKRVLIGIDRPQKATNIKTGLMSKIVLDF